MFKGSLNKKDVVIISSILGLSLVFLTFSLFLRYMVQSKGVKSKIESETTQHPSVLASSNEVNRGTSIPVLKEKSEVDEELLDLAQKIMENLPMEEIPSTSTQPMTEEINSSNVYEEKYEERTE